jgi:hypothetical protein
MLLVQTGCCSIGPVVGTLPKPDDESGKLRKRGSNGWLITWHLYPKYLPNWSYHDKRYRITVGVEDWAGKHPSIAYTGPALSLSPLSNNPEALVIWLAIEPKSRGSLSFDPARVRLVSPAGCGFTAEPSCIALGRKWEGGMHCRPAESPFSDATLADYRARFQKYVTSREPVGTLTVTKPTYAFLIFQVPAQQSGLRVSIAGLEAGGEVVSVPELRLVPWKYKDLFCERLT